MLELLASALGFGLLAVGTGFSLLGVYGVLHMPGFYNRVHAASVIITLGVGAILLSVLFLGPLDAGLRALATAAFLSLTTPMVTHVLLRTAHRQQLPLANGTARDDLANDRSDEPPYE